MKRTTCARLAAIALVAMTTNATAQDSFSVPTVRWARGIAGSGDRIWVAGGTEGLFALRRGEAPRIVEGPRSADALGVSPSGVVVVADRSSLHRLEGDRWSRGPTIPDGRFGDRVEAIHVADDGTVIAMARYGGLHIWSGRGRRVRTVSYGEGEHEASFLAVAGDRAFVTGPDRLLLEIRASRAQRPAWADAAFAALDADYQQLSAMWVAPDGHPWVGTNARRVLEVDLESDSVRVHPVEAFGRVNVISGAAGKVVVAAQSEIVVLQGDARHRVPGRYSFAEGLYVDEPTNTLYVSNRDGVAAIDLASMQPTASEPVAAIRAATVSEPSSGGDVASAMREQGLRIENMQAGCGMIPAMAIAARAQQAAGRCIRPGQSATVNLDIRNGRVTQIHTEGAAARCVQRRLRTLRVPAAQRCTATFTIAH